MATAYKRYIEQRHAAHCRGIAWKFTFEEWCDWWEEQLGLDWFKKRGPLVGQYVMARYNDTGPYSPFNVKCILSTDNIQERDSSKKLTREIVRVIFRSKESQYVLGSRYDVSPSTICNIRKRRTWVRATIDL